ncbi:MAG: hypothetical protein GTO18_02525 [Anaerolineales bacterium]|nr:hypothetical protein [Anaerolineales bacterium]
MANPTNRVTLYGTASYQICIQGTLDEDALNYLQGLKVVSWSGMGKSGTTLLRGRLLDQAALIGVLNALYDMGLSILRVEHIPDET